MKKTAYILASGRKTYTAPSVEVLAVDAEHCVIMASGGTLDNTLIMSDDDEWPDDPNTGKPYSPW